MNFMVNLMREHVPQTAVCTMSLLTAATRRTSCRNGAGVLLRPASRHRQVVQLFDRVVAAAKAAAMGTETQVDVEVMHGNYPVLPNLTSLVW